MTPGDEHSRIAVCVRVRARWVLFVFIHGLIFRSNILTSVLKMLLLMFFLGKLDEVLNACFCFVHVQVGLLLRSFHWLGGFILSGRVNWYLYRIIEFNVKCVALNKVGALHLPYYAIICSAGNHFVFNQWSNSIREKNLPDDLAALMHIRADYLAIQSQNVHDNKRNAHLNSTVFRKYPDRALEGSSNGYLENKSKHQIRKIRLEYQFNFQIK